MIDLPALLADLCSVTPDRRPGSPGNDAAVTRVADLLRGLGWTVETPRFPVVDWSGERGTLSVAGHRWTAHPSPYSTGWVGTAPVRVAETLADLDQDLAGHILLAHGELTAAPLTPRDYPFYGSDRDAVVLERLESSRAVAVLAITGRHPDLAGSVDPFPLIEDGTFRLPAAALTRADGTELLAALDRHPDSAARLRLPARRWASSARNVVARRGEQTERVTVVAHIDSKPGTPGAIDNASGVVVLCRAAELLATSSAGVELLAVNGEDYYAASGEVAYLATTDLRDIRLAINVDGAGLRGGPTAWSAYGVGDDIDLTPLAGAPGLVPGPPWPQSDHMVFAAAGRPAIALTSQDFTTVMQEVAHSPADTPDLVDVAALDRAAHGIAALVESLSGPG